MCPAVFAIDIAASEIYTVQVQRSELSQITSLQIYEQNVV